MRKLACSICGYIYDEAAGDPERGIAPGTLWADVPEEWECPLCSATKSDFQEQSGAPTVVQELSDGHDGEDMRELSFGELSALCSNLAKGCEKQYRNEEADLFNQLAEYYNSRNSLAEEGSLKELMVLIEEDLNSAYPHVNGVAARAADRGALRALVWGEKVTRILNSLLNRYNKQGEALLANTHVYVCEICGFVYIGEEAPEICPVCKVPRKKITEVKRG
ncbi:rubredoxin [Desulfitobacterium hafniense DP7]|uniref:Rubredoxin n=1 Tax=Desulfitobacterium hafniense DP7 TaxID=537010 RepID=G9XRL2_DESHA|nr:rubredoxin [Desulfitobacterium hafniense]EHL05694.1 rubredoxin [Desulfitobacterium hafniense DP7]